MERLLQLNDEDDDATSKAAPMPSEMEQQPYDHHPENAPPHQVMLVIMPTLEIEVSPTLKLFL